MSIRVFNTETRKKEPFTTIEPGHVRMYVCGPTVYDLSHLGHARCYVVWDTVVRYLRSSGYRVTHVQNYTDVDDKIIRRAQEKGIEVSDIASENIRAFDEDMALLGVETPDIRPRVTEHIDQIIRLVNKLIENGTAYESEGDVYFSVKQYKGYGRLSGRQLDKMRAGARVEPGDRKRDPLDFAVWKAAKPGEPFWDSPFGRGRPGWHIECSAMAMEYLGETLDIHAGGADLIFPHHENEIAQSEAVTCRPFAKYWMHNGFVNINEEKMSKSLGNFFTVRDLLAEHDPEVIRYLLLSVHYRSPINFADSILDDARRRLRYQYETLKRVEKVIEMIEASPESEMGEESGRGNGKGKNSGNYEQRIQSVKNGFIDAMNDDFNTAGAIGALSDAFVLLNELCDLEKKPDADKKMIRDYLLKGRECVLELSSVPGLLCSEPEKWLEADDLRGASKRGIDPAEVEKLLQARTDARKIRDFKRADEIRDELAAKGISIKDTPQGTEWFTG